MRSTCTPAATPPSPKPTPSPILGREVEWEPIYDESDITIAVASKEALLAMRLRASRPGCDTRDIRMLLALCSIETLEVAEAFYGELYPGDELTSRAVRIVAAILADGPLTPPDPPGPITWTSTL